MNASDFPWPGTLDGLDVECRPDVRDSDGDGLWDWVERLVTGTNPAIPDSDNDSVADGNEVGSFLLESKAELDLYERDPVDHDSDGIRDPLDVDDDGDGTPTRLEDQDQNGDVSNDDSDGDGRSDYLDIWQAPPEFSVGVSSAGGKPRVATNNLGRWVAVWSAASSFGSPAGTDEDILFSVSTNNGLSWSAAQTLNSNANGDIGDDVDPDIAYSAGNGWTVVWSSDDNAGGTSNSDFDLRYSRSSTGLTWTNPASIEAGAAGDSSDELDPSLRAAAAPSPKLLLVWSSAGPGSDYDLKLAASGNGGASWAPPVLIHADQFGDDRSAAIAPLGGSTWVVVWEFDASSGRPSSDVDLLYAISSTDGASWSAPSALDAGSQIDSSDEISPVLSRDGLGRIHAAWSSDGGGDFDILRSVLPSANGTWSQSVPANARANVDSGDDLEPSMAFDSDATLAIVWSSDEAVRGLFHSDFDIFSAYSEDNGSHWTLASDPINAYAGEGSDESFPVIESDSSGNWILMWTSDRIAGPTVSSDSTFVTPGFFALVSGTECSDGIDNDSDGLIDFQHPGGDPGCSQSNDTSERAEFIQCDDGRDNDGDGFIDYVDPGSVGQAGIPGDPGCLDPVFVTERPQCQDGIDNDGEVGTDYDGGESVLGAGNEDPSGPDPQCAQPWNYLETVPEPSISGMILFGVGLVAVFGGSIRRKSSRS